MRPQASRQRPLSDGPPPLTPRSLHPPHPSVLPSPSFPPLFSVIPLFKPGAGSAQAGIHATSSLPSALQLTDAPPTTRATFPSPTPPLGLALPLVPAPLFRHSCLFFSRVIPAQAGIHATSSFPSAPQISDGPPPLTPLPLRPPHAPPSFPRPLRHSCHGRRSMRPQPPFERPRSACHHRATFEGARSSRAGSRCDLIPPL